jgi:hypothetical protein
VHTQLLFNLPAPPAEKSCMRGSPRTHIQRLMTSAFMSFDCFHCATGKRHAVGLWSNVTHKLLASCGSPCCAHISQLWCSTQLTRWLPRGVGAWWKLQRCHMRHQRTKRPASQEAHAAREPNHLLGSEPVVVSSRQLVVPPLDWALPGRNNEAPKTM